MALEISSTLLARLLDNAAASPNAEICGLLFGDEDRIAHAEPCVNVAANPARRFEIDPAALFAAYRAMRAGGPTLIGHYHSHPSGNAEPSITDAEHATGDGAFWLILARADAKLWRSDRPGAFQSVDLVSTGGSCSKAIFPYLLGEVR